jgi:hypothetical protein
VPALTMCALQILFLPLVSGDIQLDRPLPVQSTDAAFQYDDGTAQWITWTGLYRGVWFRAQDFSPWAYGFCIDNLEFWFYHHLSQWDTSFFYAELWNGGGAAGPGNLIDQTSVTATHYSPVYSYYSTPILVDADFWGIINTEMSMGGWPCNLGDNTPYPVSHSFHSDDLSTWDPWLVQGTTASDYFTRANGTLITGLDQLTWGAIKTLF